MAGLSPLYGTDASLTTTGFGCHWNAFEISFAQGVTGYFGFGDTWMTNHGTINSWAGSMAGFTTSGTTADVLAISTVLVRSGLSQTFTWKTGCTVAGTIIITGLAAGVQFLGTDTSGYSFVATGSPTETWATS